MPPKITLFYSPSPAVSKGEAAKLCYSTESVASVKLEPAVAEVYPAYSRCVEFIPERTAEYKLIATGKSGDEVTAKAAIEVGAARPKFTDLQINSTSVAKGERIHFCFKSVNAVSVKGGPGTFHKGGNAASDCLLDAPQQTTTYQLTIANATGQTDTDSITVQVKGSK